ncbi:hypothetical protein ACXJJ3_32885 [Kribbella sp. WER1]
MNRQDALKAAEELVTRLAPATNNRGYLEGTTPLNVRVAEILRVAEFLQQEGEKDAATAPGHVVIDGDGDRWTLYSAEPEATYAYNECYKTLMEIAMDHGVQRIEVAA